MIDKKIVRHISIVLNGIDTELRLTPIRAKSKHFLLGIVKLVKFLSEANTLNQKVLIGRCRCFVRQQHFHISTRNSGRECLDYHRFASLYRTLHITQLKCSVEVRSILSCHTTFDFSLLGYYTFTQPIVERQA